MNRVLAVVAFASFASALFARITDPLVPAIALDLDVDVKSAALLGTAFALPWAVMQPVLGPLGDLLGKTRVITACLAVLIVSSAIGALSTSFSTLLISRIIAGAAAGGVGPVAMAFVSDLVPMNQRQAAMGRQLMMSIAAQLMGSVAAGLVSDFLGWRTIFMAVGAINALALLGATVVFRGLEQPRGRLHLGAIVANHRLVLANPLTKVCYSAVFLEGIALMGLFPFIAIMLRAAGEERASIAGLVISAYAIGGVVYALGVRALVARFDPPNLMAAGGLISAVGLLVEAAALPWPLQVVALGLMGFGFYLLHGCILLYMSELAPQARGTAVADHAFSYYLGQALGPVAYAFGFSALGATWTCVAAAVIIALTGVFTGRLLGPPAGVSRA